MPETGIRNVVIKTIPHDQQRYNTIGDWIIVGDTLTVTTSELGDWRESFVCAIHESIEAALCVNDDVSEESVSDFDIRYEKEREQGEHADHEEPGEDPSAPYRRQHAFADGVERLLANQLGVVWYRYQEKVENLEYRPERESNDASP